MATDFPTVREILSGKNSVLVAPDSAVSLAEGIRGLLADAALMDRIARQARLDAEAYTWERRAENILNILEDR